MSAGRLAADFLSERCSVVLVRATMDGGKWRQMHAESVGVSFELGLYPALSVADEPDAEFKVIENDGF
jgi:hypothetical protein